MIKSNEELKLAILSFPDAKQEKRVAEYFRNIDESTVMELSDLYIELTYGKSRISFIKVLSNVLRSKECLVLILKVGIEKKLASEIKGWLKALVPKIGFNRVFHELKQIDDFEALDIMVYQLRWLVSEKELLKLDKWFSFITSEKN